MATVSINYPGGDLSTYVATPDGAGPWPGVCVIHDALGMSQDLRDQADWLAGEGYLAAAPDLFAGGTFLGCVRTIMRDFSRGEGPLFDKQEMSQVLGTSHLPAQSDFVPRAEALARPARTACPKLDDPSGSLDRL